MISWAMRPWHVAVFLLASGVAGCPSKDIPVPAALSEDSDVILKAKYHAEDVFTLEQADGTYKALVFKLPKASAADSDYRVVFYRQEGNTFLRHGAEANLVNFERPRLSHEATPRIETTLNRLGVRYHFIVDATGAEMVPSEGLDDGGALRGHPAAR
jgi:hypothetical protein